MKKRVVAFVVCLCIMFISLCGRLFVLTVTSREVATQTSSRVKNIAFVRGYIYDRNLTPLTNDTLTQTICIKPTFEAYKIISSQNENTDILPQIKKGKFTTKVVKKTDIYANCEDIKVLNTFQRYASNQLIHILGYTDKSGKGVYGIEKYYNDFLTETGGTLSAEYSADANGRMLTGERTEIRDNGYYDKDGVVLTIDKKMQNILETALLNGKIEKGAGIILNTQTNEILACASTPVFDRNNLTDAVNDKNLPFLNRAFSAFPVGSVFKLVTAASALENNIPTPNFNCTGKIEFNRNVFRCNKLDGHGVIDFDTAIAKSCNPYFINFGTKVGAEKLLNTAKKFKFGQSIDFGNGLCTDTGTLPPATDFVCNADIGNFAFGQGNLSATPVQIATMLSAIGNGGYYITPTLILGKTDKAGKLTKNENQEKIKILKNSTCNTLKRAMKKTVTDGTGAYAKSPLYTSCTKTATAQSGQYDENGNEIKFCWFVGFFPEDKPQYTICIMKEDGVSGGSDCGPVFREIAENILFNF